MTIGSPANVHNSIYLNSREAAAYLHVNHRTLLEWTRRGELPGIPLGGGKRNTWLFSKPALDEALCAKMAMNRSRLIQETLHVK
jgi:excisionase family DNA binding protein